MSFHDAPPGDRRIHSQMYCLNSDRTNRLIVATHSSNDIVAMPPHSHRRKRFIDGNCTAIQSTTFSWES